MSSNIKLKNDINTELSIVHENGAPARELIGKDIAIAVDTIADFPTLLSASNTDDVVIVREPGRGGTFIYDHARVLENNSGTVFDGWVRRYSGAVNVLWFGAVGDGITDDTAAIQSAIAESGLGGTVFLPKPSNFYSVTKLSFGGIGARLVGEGSANRTDTRNGNYDRATTIVFSTTTESALTLGNVSYGVKQKVIENISLVFNSDSGIYGINATNSPNSTYKNVSIFQNGLGNGINLFDCWISTFNQCFIEKIDANVRTGIGVNIDNTGLGGLYNFIHGTTIYQWATGIQTYSCENVNLIGAQLKSNNNGLIANTGTTNVLIQGSYLEGQVNRSVFVTNEASSISVKDNFINDPSASIGSICLGVGGGTEEAKSFHNVVIEDNLFESCNTIGIAYVGSSTLVPSGIEIHRNKFDGTGTAVSLVGSKLDISIDKNSYSSGITQLSGSNRISKKLDFNEYYSIADGVSTVLKSIGTSTNSITSFEATINSMETTGNNGAIQRKILFSVRNRLDVLTLSTVLTDSNHTADFSNSNYIIEVTEFTPIISGSNINIQATLTSTGLISWGITNTEINLKVLSTAPIADIT